MNEMSEEEAALVRHLADMEEDEALEIAKRMLLEEGADPLRVQIGRASCRERVS
jgi:hypothetical protein